MTITDNKDTKLSNKVQDILYKRGYSHIFNWIDYHLYKRECKHAIFKAEAIADLFIENTLELSDYAEYEF